MNNCLEKPQVMRIDTSQMTPEQTLSMAHAYLGEEYRALPLPSHAPNIGGAGDLWVLGNISAAVDYGINARLQRRCARSLAETVRCRVITSGRIDGVADGRVVSLRPGDVVFEASNLSFSLDLENFGCDVIGVSAAALGHERIGDLSYRILSRESPEAALIAASLCAFLTQLDRCDIAAAERSARLVLAIVERQFDNFKSGPSDASLWAREGQRPMLQFIEDNLSNPDLGVDQLVHAFATSRAVVYRTLEEHGGIARYISRRRLERSLSQLVFDRPDTSIGQVAQSLGFTDQSYFAKLFKNQFGISPSRARSVFSFDRHELDQEKDGIMMRELLNRSEHISMTN
ncbi:MAG: AraC family transcriptional regulator [Pseudomonadota bacterium]